MNRVNSGDVMNALIQMQAELESSPLVVVLAPSKRWDRREWDCIRVCLSVPPTWYRKLCNRHASSRGVRRGKFDTRIRRANVLSALQGLIEGRYKGKYAQEILGIARTIK